MISAVRNRKAHIEIKEDTLTSIVFDNLFHLPYNFFWEIIKKSCYNNNKLPDSINSIKKSYFWPSWECEGTRVEPDLFIRFDNFDLIIEAKLENNSQDCVQWKRQCIGYKNKYEQDKREVRFLAIGGITNENKEYIDIENYHKIEVVKCRWSNIFETIVNLRSELKNDNIIRIIKS